MTTPRTNYNKLILLINLKISNKFTEIDIKNCTYYFLDDMIDIKNLNPNKIKIDKKPYKSTFIGYVTIKNFSYIKIKSLNPL